MDIKKLFPVFLSGLILVLVIWQIQPPKHLISINFSQTILFFVPLFLFLFFLINLILNFLLWNAVISLGLILLLTLKALGFLNPITFVLTLTAIGFFLKSYKRPKRFGLRNLFYSAKIPKLSRLKKQR